MKRINVAVAVMGTIAVLSGFVPQADAARGISTRVRCEQRVDRRSKISVDGKRVGPGTFSARVTSGAQVAVTPAETAVGREVEFDFDSNRGNITAGATAIDKAFITDGQVLGEILDANGNVVSSATADCRVRA